MPSVTRTSVLPVCVGGGGRSTTSFSLSPPRVPHRSASTQCHRDVAVLHNDKADVTLCAGLSNVVLAMPQTKGAEGALCIAHTLLPSR